MSKETIFEKIIKGKIPTKILYKDELSTAFYDVKPQAPIHFLVVPNTFISSLNKITKNNKTIIGHMIYVAIKIAKKLGISKKGYRLIINCNKNGGQEIQYLHIHILGGKKLNNKIN